MISIIVPYYRNPAMLKVHLRHWGELYGDSARQNLRWIVIDDGSPEPAENVLRPYQAMLDSIGARLYRIEVNIPWNRNGARNLGATVAETDWIVQIDIDHVLPPTSAATLAEPRELDPAYWYRFRRFRIGRADETRKKDKLPPDQEYGEIKPHIDSYLVTRDLYWKAGGYNEDFRGFLGGGSPFLRELEKVGGPPIVTKIPLHVYTRNACEDASDNTLSRDRDAYKRRSAELERAGKIKGHDPLRFPWHRVF